MESLGGIYIEISADVEPLLSGAKEAKAALDSIATSVKPSDKALGGLEKTVADTGKSFDTMAGYSKSMDGSLRTLNTSVNAIAKAMLEARTNTGGAGAEFSRAEAIIEGLGNQLAILEEAQEGSARSAAILAAQLRAGSTASEEEKKHIGELTGRLFDMKNSTDAGVKGHTNWKNSMQQAGYQVQDFIVQVQGGQSALVAFSQQGSQLAGAFGPGGAVIGSIIALSTVVAGTLITSLNGGKSAMDALKDSIETADKVITISQNGVSALSNEYAALAKNNIRAASLMIQLAEAELQSAMAKVSTEVQKASKDFVTFGDSLVSSLGGSYASVKLFNDYLSTLSITTNDWGEAMKQAAASGRDGQTTMQSMIATVGALASKFDISDQKAYEFAKQLSDIAKTPSKDKLNDLLATLVDVSKGHSKGAAVAQEYADKIGTIIKSASSAEDRLRALRNITDELTSSQDKAIKIAQQELFIAKQTGDARNKAQAWRDAETQGLKEGTQAFRDYYNVKLAIYRQNEQNAKSTKENNKATSQEASQAERNARVLEEYRQKAQLTADSTSDLSREQAILAATQKLANPTPQMVAQVERDAAAAWDKAAALKAQNAVPELKENADYNSQKAALESLKGQTDANGQLLLSQEQYSRESERIEQEHQANLAKIKAGQVVTPQQQAVGSVDPVQQLANENAQKLALIQQFETNKTLTEQQALALRNAANTQYEKARTDAQWEIYRNQSTVNELMASAIDGFSSQAASSLTGYINGTQTAAEATENLGNAILNSVIQSLVEVGIQYLKNAAMAMLADKMASSSSQQSAAATATAWAPAAAAASIATFGGAAVAGIAGMVAAFAIGAALAGKRKNGGPVTAGGMYEFGEGNLPEVFQSGGKNYMLPGNNGRVISNKDLSQGIPKASTGSNYLKSSGSSSERPAQVQGGGSPTVIIHNYASSAQVQDYQMSKGPDGRDVLEFAIADINSGGPLSRAISTNHQAPRKALE
ncbi:phage tail length tape-measure protein [Buttiauxella noackiae ATCC 51607]|uniref:Phage tail length tape-measure protein n=1 Tax=Buttiauxella noackiae ATCC 51607 TaxID=1354255 RepID=A0A1B7HZF6_9ENTR|nr:phage tail tape measure protein [Buttiauxella noackiae]OAT21102.1 phage tail length tape-measure protein [Buttiauxella noackiae ATCC 51607]